MPSAAIVVLADTETHADLGRLTNALIAAKEFKEAGDDVQVIFDGAGTKWVARLSDPDHPKHSLFRELTDVIVGACSFCAEAFHVKEEVNDTDVHLVDQYERHPSFRKLLGDGYQVITF